MPSIRERLAGWIDSVLYVPPRDENTRAYYIIHDYAYVGELLQYLDELKKQYKEQEA